MIKVMVLKMELTLQTTIIMAQPKADTTIMIITKLRITTNKPQDHQVSKVTTDMNEIVVWQFHSQIKGAILSPKHLIIRLIIKILANSIILKNDFNVKTLTKLIRSFHLLFSGFLPFLLPASENSTISYGILYFARSFTMISSKL